MWRATCLSVLSLVAAPCLADDDPAPAPAPASSAPVEHAALPVVPVTTTGNTDTPIKASSTAKWAVAGYNGEEILYTVVLTSHDPRIVRCITRLSGYYYENGQKQTVSDQQITTLFPEHVMEIGNWVGMDEKSGATYTVTCHPI